MNISSFRVGKTKPIHNLSQRIPEQHQGRFDIVVGKSASVNQHMNTLKQQHDHFGQLCLSANVVESSSNYQVVPSEDATMNRLLDYIDFENKTRNGRLGEDAAFVYPLKQPASITSKTPKRDQYEVGIYADGQDLNAFLNYVGEETWNGVVNKSPDRITDFALQFAESVQRDAQGQPIHVQQLDPPPRVKPPTALPTKAPSFDVEKTANGFLNLFA